MKKIILMFICYMYALSLSAQKSAISATDTAKTGGYNLPEVKIQDSQSKTSAKQETPFNTAFYKYVTQVKEKISGNDGIFAMLKVNSLSYKEPLTKKLKKYRRIVASLEEVNNELKADLEYYIKYGTGNWLKFKEEFNEDLTFLDQNLKEINHEGEELTAIVNP